MGVMQHLIAFIKSRVNINQLIGEKNYFDVFVEDFEIIEFSRGCEPCKNTHLAPTANVE